MNWKAWTIAKREVKALFVSPIAYVVLAIYALLSGFHFLSNWENFDRILQQARMQAQLSRNPDILNYVNINGLLIANVVGFAFFLLLFTIPAITMRLLSEERNQGTYELLMTSPISTWDVILGKFLGGFLFFLTMILTHGLFIGVVFIYGNPEPGPIISAYTGVLLGGAVFYAAGLFASALTRNQIVAFILALGINLALLMIGWAAQSASGNLSEFLSAASIMSNFESFNKGIITASGVVYFVTLTVGFLAASRLAVESSLRN